MKTPNILALVTLVSLSMGAISSFALASDNDSRVNRRAELVKMLTCSTSADPADLIEKIESLGGHLMVKSTGSVNSEYSIPEAVTLFGSPVSRIEIRNASNADGVYVEYVSYIPEQDTAEFATLAGLARDANGRYLKEIGGSDLSVKKESETSVLVCANDVRTAVKSVNRVTKQINEKINSATRQP